MVNQSGAIYWYQCGDLGCDDEYIGETSRTFGERYKERLKAPSAIHHHSNQTGHTTNQNNFQIIGREGHNLARNIKESIYIRVNNPTLNNNIGKFNLSHIWDRVLINRMRNLHQISKCHFFAKEIQYVGHIISTTGIKPLPSKMETIKIRQPPENAKQVQAFLGLLG